MDEWWDFTDDELDLLDLSELKIAHERALAEVRPAEDAADLDAQLLSGDNPTPEAVEARQQALKAENRYNRIRAAYDRRLGH